MKKKNKILMLVLLVSVILLSSFVLASCSKNPDQKHISKFDFSISSSNLIDGYKITSNDMSALKEYKVNAKYNYAQKDKQIDLLAVSLKDLLEYKYFGINSKFKNIDDFKKPNKISIIDGYGEYVDLGKDINKIYIAYAYKNNKNGYQSLIFNNDIKKAICFVKDSKIVAEGVKNMYFNTPKEQICCQVTYLDDNLDDFYKNYKLPNGKKPFGNAQVNNGSSFTFDSFTTLVNERDFKLENYKTSKGQITNLDTPTSLATLKGQIKAISLYDYIKYIVGDSNYKIPEEVNLTFDTYSKEDKKRIVKESIKVKTRETLIYYPYELLGLSKKISISIVQKDENDFYNKLIAEECSYIKIQKI